MNMFNKVIGAWSTRLARGGKLLGKDEDEGLGRTDGVTEEEREREWGKD